MSISQIAVSADVTYTTPTSFVYAVKILTGLMFFLTPDDGEY